MKIAVTYENGDIFQHFGHTEQFKVFFQSMLNQGYYLPPSQFECWFVSQAHTDEDIENTIKAAEQAFMAVAAM